MSYLRGSAHKVVKEVCKVVTGKDECIEKVMIAIIAGGHILIEDIPGVGKTTMAIAFSKAMELEQKRVQFTPDVLPSDITGFYMFQKETKSFKYIKGPIMSNIFLADEINRTSPKTQSALLEVMEEGKVTVDGHTMKVPDPFIVIATQNPVGSAGTHLLPESQMDRFAICLSLGYPSAGDEMRMVKLHARGDMLSEVQVILNTQEILKMRQEVEAIYIHDAIYDYIVALSRATRDHELVKLGMSPRGTLALCRMAQGASYLRGRDYVQPEDVSYIFRETAGHRIVLDSRAKMEAITTGQIIDQILKTVKRPVPKR